MAHRNEQGNVLAFVLVGAVLAALLVGGIFIVKNQLAGNEVALQGSTDSSNGDGQSSEDGTRSGDNSGDATSDDQKL